MFSRTRTMKSTAGSWDEIARLKGEMDSADAIVIGAGSGLSTSAGFTYTGSRFEENFGDFIEKYGFRDMYSGDFIPSRRRKSTGLTGAVISGTTGIRMPRRILTNSFCGWWREKNISC